jgi:hypothetical protein
VEYLSQVLSQRGPQAVPYEEAAKWKIREHVSELLKVGAAGLGRWCSSRHNACPACSCMVTPAAPSSAWLWVGGTVVLLVLLISSVHTHWHGLSSAACVVWWAQLPCASRKAVLEPYLACHVRVGCL